MEPLTPRQRQVLDLLRQRVRASIREIADDLGIASPAGVVRHLEALERKGYIRRAPGARAVQIVPGEGRGEPEVVYLPIVGRVAAGAPILAEENVEGYEAVSRRLVRHRHAFLLRVDGDSMIGDHILDGDLVIVEPRETVENGDIVVALLGDEATVKRYYQRRDHIELRPSNRRYKPIEAREGVEIVGKVVGVQRRLA